MKKLKVFISGPMTGYEDYNREAFNAMEKELKEAGYSVFNPAWLKVDEEWTHEDLMAIDLVALSMCDAIVQLDGWGRSEGAKIEHAFAKANGKRFIQLEARKREKYSLEWIPCSERLPEKDGLYLVTNSRCGSNLREISSWSQGGWLSRNKPIAWMPLPEAYEKRGLKG